MECSCRLGLSGTFFSGGQRQANDIVSKRKNVTHAVKMRPGVTRLYIKIGCRNGVCKIPTLIWCPGDGKDVASFHKAKKAARLFRQALAAEDAGTSPEPFSLPEKLSWRL